MKIKTFIHYNLYGEEDKNLLPEFIHCETIEARSRAYNWEIKPHVHLNLFQVFLFEVGEGFLLYENQEIALQTPCIVVLPANHLHGFRYTSETNGRVLTISDTYLETLFATSPNVVLALNQMQYLKIEKEKIRFESLIRILDRISRELYEVLPEKRLALQAYLSILMVELFRFVSEEKNNNQKLDNRQLVYFQNFQKNIKKNLSATKTIQDYAKELQITTVHLNRVCQGVAQKTASQIVEDYIVAEAKKYLLHTSYTITEIAYLLDFNDAAYFSRLFKKLVGKTPKEFRV